MAADRRVPTWVAVVAVGAAVALGVAVPTLLSRRTPQAHAASAPSWTVSGLTERVARIEGSPLTAAVAATGGRALVGTSAGGTYLIDVAHAGEPVAGHRLSARVMSVAVSADGTTFAAIDQSGNVAVWQGVDSVLVSGQIDDSYDVVALDTHGTRLAAAGLQVSVWSLPDGQRISTGERRMLEGATPLYGSLAFTGADRLVADSDRWGVSGAAATQTSTTCTCILGSAAWSTDAGAVALGTKDGRILVLDERSGRTLSDQTVDVGAGSYAQTHVLLDPEDVLFSSSRTDLGVWSTAARRVTWSTDLPEAPVGVSVAPDRSTVVVTTEVEAAEGYAVELWAGALRH